MVVMMVNMSKLWMVVSMHVPVSMHMMTTSKHEWMSMPLLDLASAVVCRCRLTLDHCSGVSESALEVAPT